jgi:Raf kinase inhibitor-like YbhB/YbcL family protein
MRYLQITAACAILLSTSVAALAQTPAPPPPTPMSLTSSSFTDGGIIPDKYTGVNATPVSPALAWDNAPAGTVSFTLIMHDPDNTPQKHIADTLHWMMFNIPAATHALAEGQPAVAQLPDGSIQGKTRVVGFMGPGARGNVYHHYTLELFALDTKLDLGPDATRDDVQKAMDGHILGKAVDEGRFHR